jgi:uncharacterized phage protein gp47/JayE
MATFGITNQGFVLKRAADIQSDLVAALSTIVDLETGESLSVILSDENDPIAQVVNAFSAALAEPWEQLELAYNQFDPLKATGAGLKGTVQLNGITALPGTYSKVTLSLVGTPNLAFSAGKKVSKMDDSVVFTLPAVLFDNQGVAVVQGTATVKGPLTAEIAEVVKIVTPVSGWTSVTNAAAAVPGTLEETDTQLRARQQVSTSLTAQSIVESIYSGVANLTGVSFCKVYQNIDMTEDGRTIPAKSIAVVVEGGDNHEIAQVIFNKNPMAGTFGDISVSIVDIQGLSNEIKFSRPTPVDIYATINVTVVDVGKWPVTGEEDIKAAIIAYALVHYALPGEDIYASDLFIPVLTVPGIKVTGITIAKTEQPTADEVPFAWNEVVSFTTAKINVVVTGV